MLVLRNLQRRLVAGICSTNSCGTRQYHVALRSATKRSAVPALSASSMTRGSISGANNNSLATFHVEKRSMSSATDGLRAFPQFSVYGETAVLSLKMIAPKFKVVKNQILVPDKANRGRLLLEFTARTTTDINWNDQVRFALDPSEVGLLVSQLPHNPVEWARRPAGANSFGLADTPEDGMNTDMPDKVLSIEPQEGARVKFTLDFKKDGVGGQDPMAPMEVTAEAGEFEVMRSIMQSSLPFLSGWQTLMEVGAKYDLEGIRQPHSGGGQFY
mmetsp:Transcript_15499/g.18673  ORF Transcript_15499/g.18673 Transcript_15499/m.18673 type:complete len:272 (-) Transcript_15499:41-856(-)